MSLTSVKEYFSPEGKDRALELLGTYGDAALIVAGGTFVHGLDARDLLVGIEALIDIRNLGLDQINRSDAGLEIGAMVTFKALQELPEVRQDPALGAVQDALKYPPLQIRNVATVGGNIASACPYFDLPTASMALGAVIRALGPNGQRDIDAQDFSAGLFQNTLESSEFVSSVLIPKHPPRSGSAFIKFETNANDLAIVNVATRVTLDDSGRCTDAGIVVGGGVAEIPVRATAAENELQGKPLSDEVIAQAASAAQSELDPMSDHRASAAYRSLLAKVLTERALKKAIARLDERG